MRSYGSVFRPLPSLPLLSASCLSLLSVQYSLLQPQINPFFVSRKHEQRRSEGFVPVSYLFLMSSNSTAFPSIFFYKNYFYCLFQRSMLPNSLNFERLNWQGSKFLITMKRHKAWRQKLKLFLKISVKPGYSAKTTTYVGWSKRNFFVLVFFEDYKLFPTSGTMLTRSKEKKAHSSQSKHLCCP